MGSTVVSTKASTGRISETAKADGELGNRTVLQEVKASCMECIHLIRASPWLKTCQPDCHNRCDACRALCHQLCPNVSQQFCHDRAHTSVL